MDGVARTRTYGKQDHSYWLQLDLNAVRKQLSWCDEEIALLRKKNASLEAENIKLKQRIKDLTEQSAPASREVPSFVKPNAKKRPQRKRGRPQGHEGSLRPLPKKIDVRQDVALPKDRRGQPSCPECRTQLSELKHHRRIVEDMIPAKQVRTCYHTHSGYCPSCRRRMESPAVAAVSRGHKLGPSSPASCAPHSNKVVIW